ncbi:cyclin-K [Scaptodrosophila lebanonensis]|uniref:Cyclin-K n=1 Tax=Drosophila lebanonensis TaxID=7225 RepID=A0A6J2TQ39_DROLE|nr:cyclin-K [Scaptodrosophila lebanonensis]
MLLRFFVITVLIWAYCDLGYADSDSSASSGSESGESHHYRQGKHHKDKYNRPAYPAYPNSYTPISPPYYYGGYPYMTAPPTPPQPFNGMPPQPYPYPVPYYPPYAESSNPHLPSGPQPASSVINHSLKVNKEYKEDGHHSNQI